jgi:hypothetical protein
MFILCKGLDATRTMYTTQYQVSSLGKKNASSKIRQTTVSVYIPVTKRIASANTKPTAGVSSRHVIPLMDLQLGKASVLLDGQCLHSPVVPGERME